MPGGSAREEFNQQEVLNRGLAPGPGEAAEELRVPPLLSAEDVQFVNSAAGERGQIGE